METFTTERFKVTPATYARLQMLRHLGQWWYLWLIPVAPVVVWFCTGNMAWLLGALMAIFIVCPAFMALVYFYHGLSPDLKNVILPHTIKKTYEGIEIMVYGNEENPHLKTGEMFYPHSEIRQVEDSGTQIIYTLRNGIIIPIPTKYIKDFKSQVDGSKSPVDGSKSHKGKET